MNQFAKTLIKTAPLLYSIALFFIVYLPVSNTVMAQESADQKLLNVKDAINQQKSAIKQVDLSLIHI